MPGKKSNHSLDDQLDRTGREIVRALATSEADLERIVSSPLLYAGIRSRIASERKRREEGEPWFMLLAVFWRSVPAMALVAAFAFALFWSASLRRPLPTVPGVESLFEARDTGIRRVLFADDSGLSSDEVLATILNDDEQEDPR